MSRRDGGRQGLPAVDLRMRDLELRELMDDPDCDPRALARTFRRFAVVNSLVSGWRAAWRTHVVPALPASGRGRVLDLGCGGGDLARALVRWAASDGFDIEVVGVDPDPRAIAAATRAVPRGVSFREQSSGDLVAAGERFDVVVSNHVLHHLGDEERAGFLGDSERLASTRSLHSDIRRSASAYRAYALGSVLVAAGTFVRVDGLRSIRRSFTLPELRTALPAGWRAESAAPHRVLAIHDA